MHSNIRRNGFVFVIAFLLVSSLWGGPPTMAFGQDGSTPPPPPQLIPGDSGGLAAQCTAPGLPPIPKLTAPANGSTLIITNPLLKWSGATGYCINYYNVQVWVDGGNMVLSAWPTTSAYTVPAGKLAFGVKYNWYVWGHNGKGFGDPMVASFSTTTVNNDDFGFPTVITTPTYTTTEVTTAATTSADDPAILAACGTGQGTHSVWWSFTPNSTGTLDVNTAGSNYDTLLAVWTGMRGNLAIVPSGCNDNGSAGITSAVTGLVMTPGKTYYIEVVQSGAASQDCALAPSGCSLSLSVVFNSFAQTKKYTSEPALDGWVLETGDGTNKGGSLNSTSDTMIVGNTHNGRKYYSFLSFYAASNPIPSNAVIISAVVTLRKSTVSVPNPFDLYPSLVVDIRKGYFGTKVALAISDWQAAANLKQAGAIIEPPNPSDPYSATLIPAAFPFINRAGRTQFKVRFTGDDVENGYANTVYFYTGEAATVSYRPVLVVTYYIR